MDASDSRECVKKNWIPDAKIAPVQSDKNRSPGSKASSSQSRDKTSVDQKFLKQRVVVAFCGSISKNTILMKTGLSFQPSGENQNVLASFFTFPSLCPSLSL